MERGFNSRCFFATLQAHNADSQQTGLLSPFGLISVFWSFDTSSICHDLALQTKCIIGLDRPAGTRIPPVNFIFNIQTIQNLELIRTKTKHDT